MSWIKAFSLLIVLSALVVVAGVVIGGQGAPILGNPIPLASALDKLEATVYQKSMKATATTEAMAHLYIVNPLVANGGAGTGFANLFSTHPPIEERVRHLRQMAVTV